MQGQGSETSALLCDIGGSSWALGKSSSCIISLVRPWKAAGFSHSTKVYGLAQVHLHIPADLVSERNDVLRLAGQVAVNFLVELRRHVHARIELALETCFLDFLRRVVAVRGRERLPLLGQNPVAMEVPIQSKVAQNIKRIIDVLENPARFI